jgi:hypothetical protein
LVEPTPQCLQNFFFFPTLVGGGDTDDKVAIAHCSVFDLNYELVSRENHSDETDIVAVDTNKSTIEYKKHNSLEYANLEHP